MSEFDPRGEVSIFQKYQIQTNLSYQSGIQSISLNAMVKLIDDFFNKDNLKTADNLKNKDDHKNEDNHKN